MHIWIMTQDGQLSFCWTSTSITSRNCADICKTSALLLSTPLSNMRGFCALCLPSVSIFFWEKTAERAPDTEFQKGCLHSDFWRGTSLAPTAPYIRRTFGNPGVRCQPRVKFVKLLWNFKCFLLRNKWDGENRGVIIRIRSPYKDPLGIWNFKGSLHVFVWTRASE